jgi:peptidoglycan/xylan/chitin deacetylase (PgdA/CDA1 family)
MIKNMKRAIMGVMFFAPMLFYIFLPQKLFAQDINLVSNGDMELAGSNNSPMNWNIGSFGVSSTTFTYPVSGFTGNGVRIDVSNFSTGDAKWIFQEVPIISGHQYTYSDEYSSNQTTQLVAEYFDANHNHLSFGGFLGVVSSTIDASSPTWKSVSTDFIPPQGAAFMSVFHVLSSNGTLSIDNVSLVEDPNPIPFQTGIVSLTFDDGWTSQYNNAFSEMKKNNIPATYFIFTTPMHDSGRNLFNDSAAITDMQVTTNEHGTSWAPIYLESNQDYFIRSNYISNATSTISVTYTVGTTPTTITSTEFTGGDNMYSTFSFHIPSGINPGVTINFSSGGNLTVGTDRVLEETASGYMGAAELKELQRNGNEIAVHTRDHCNLVFVTDPNRCAYMPNPNPTNLDAQINGAVNDLLAEGLSPANIIAYPYGSYDSNVIDFLKAGNKIIGGRTIDIGYNYKNTNKYALKVQIVDASTTPSQVEAWVNSAEIDKSWLILVFHQIDNPAALASNNENGGTTPEVFKTILDYIRSRPVQIRTINDVVNSLMSTSVDVTSPVISTKNDIIEYTNINNPFVVTYTSPTATDNIDPSVSVSCSPTSGSFFNIGTTTVNCSSTDTSGNIGTSSFNIGVIYIPESTTTTPVATSTPTASLVEILPSALSSGTQGQNYDQTLTASSTANGPFTWSIIDGNLPSGLNINENTGQISGTLSFSGSNNFTVLVTNGTASTTKSYSINSNAQQATEPVNNNGGGGGGGGIIANGPIVSSFSQIGQVLGANTTSLDELMKQLKGLYKLLIKLQFKAAKCSYSWNNDLTFGNSNLDVRNLQSALNFSNLTNVNTTGYGSRGFETIYFRNSTKNAVIKLQRIFSDEISFADGLVGSSTRVVLNNLCTANI